jgi:hypothetical protein
LLTLFKFSGVNLMIAMIICRFAGQNSNVLNIVLYVVIFLFIIGMSYFSKKIANKAVLKKHLIRERNNIINYAISHGGKITIAEAYSVSTLDNETIKELLEDLSSEAVCTMNVDDDGAIFYVFKNSSNIKGNHI